MFYYSHFSPKPKETELITCQKVSNHIFHCCYSKKENTEPKTTKETVREISGHHNEIKYFCFYTIINYFLCWNWEQFKTTVGGTHKVSFLPYTAHGRIPDISALWQAKHLFNSSCSQCQIHLSSNSFSKEWHFSLRIICYFTLKWEDEAFPYFAQESKEIN